MVNPFFCLHQLFKFPVRRCSGLPLHLRTGILIEQLSLVTPAIRYLEQREKKTLTSVTQGFRLEG